MTDDQPTDDEPTYDDAELAEAARLGRALEGTGTKGAHGLHDALEAAEVVSLLRAPLLDDDRAALAFASAERKIARARTRSRALFLAASAAGGLAVAATALFFVTPNASPATSPSSSDQPAAAALTSAQVAWLEAPTPTSRAALEAALSAYREENLVATTRRYAR